MCKSTNSRFSKLWKRFFKRRLRVCVTEQVCRLWKNNNLCALSWSGDKYSNVEFICIEFSCGLMNFGITISQTAARWFFTKIYSNESDNSHGSCLEVIVYNVNVCMRVIHCLLNNGSKNSVCHWPIEMDKPRDLWNCRSILILHIMHRKQTKFQLFAVL